MTGSVRFCLELCAAREVKGTLKRVVQLHTVLWSWSREDGRGRGQVDVRLSPLWYERAIERPMGTIQKACY